MIDLHTHSRYSDGSATPTELARDGARLGLSAMALTDHDTTAGFAEFAAACLDEGVEAVPGVELSLTDPQFPRHGRPRSVHVLAYFMPLEPGHPLQERLSAQRLDRRRRNEQLIELLHTQGLERVTFADVIAEAGGVDNVGRPHVATVMIRAYPERFGQPSPAATQLVFAEWLGSDGRAYVPRETDTIDAFVDAARGTGVFFAVAHPVMNYLEDASLATVERSMPAIIASLRERGVGGVESYYGGFDTATRALLVKLTRDAGLVPTGGSDYHGRYKPDVALGRGRSRDLRVPDEILEEMKQRR